MIFRNPQGIYIDFKSGINCSMPYGLLQIRSIGFFNKGPHCIGFTFECLFI